MVRTDGRSVGRSVYCHVISKCSGMGRFTKLWGSDYSRALSARVDLRYDANESTRRLVEDWMSTRLTNKHTARGFSILHHVFAQKQYILCSGIRHKSYLNYYMLHRFEIFSALELSRMAQLGSRLVASRLRKAASWQSVATHKCLKQSWSLSLV